MNITILIDHTNHSRSNSFYGIANALRNNNSVSQVAVASRGTQLNLPFFKGESNAKLFGIELKEDLSFPIHDLKRIDHAIDFQDSDAVLLRVPHPVSLGFFEKIVGLVDEQKIINQPKGILETGNKEFLLTLDSHVAPMELCYTFDDIYNFCSQYECVLKPLTGYGGKGILRVRNYKVHSEDGVITLDEFMEEYANDPQTYLAMKFLKNVTKGDKRIVVVNGKVISSSLRIPDKGKWLCNVSQGGKDYKTELTSEEYDIMDYLTPILKSNGIFYYGLDTLEDDGGKRIISEINVMSPGGLTPAELHSNEPINSVFADELVKHLKSI